MTSPLLACRGLCYRYGALQAIADLDFDLMAGEMHALIGPNGAGKTTFVNLLSGELPPDAGKILLDGKDITRAPMHERVAAGIVRSYQIPQLFPRLSALENVALALPARRRHRYVFWRKASTDLASLEEAEAWLDRVGLAEQVGLPAAMLSHGERRRLELAMTLASGARLLLLDEPLAGLSAEESAQMANLIAALKEARTVLFIEHDLDHVFRLAHRITVLVEGRCLASGDPDSIRAHREVRRAYLGEWA
ncbi:MAG: ABC transporter ATP-binding protein [Rhodocyclaceae bacterium]|nr:ABC transporter ATP-binding protein [Rhodocyclaceae bacterium]